VALFRGIKAGASDRDTGHSNPTSPSILTQPATYPRARDDSIPHLQVDLDDERSLLRRAQGKQGMHFQTAVTTHQLQAPRHSYEANERRDAGGNATSW